MTDAPERLKISHSLTLGVTFEKTPDLRAFFPATEYIRADLARPMTVAEAAKVRETDDEAEVMRRLIEGERIFYSQDGKVAWLSDADRAHVSYRVVWALRNQGYLKRVSSEGGRVFCDEASDSLRALSQGGE